jgi:hypothetical protein
MVLLMLSLYGAKSFTRLESVVTPLFIVYPPCVTTSFCENTVKAANNSTANIERKRYIIKNASENERYKFYTPNNYFFDAKPRP